MSSNSPLTSDNDPIYGSVAMGDIRNELEDAYGDELYEDDENDGEYDPDNDQEFQDDGSNYHDDQVRFTIMW